MHSFYTLFAAACLCVSTLTFAGDGRDSNYTDDSYDQATGIYISTVKRDIHTERDDSFKLSTDYNPTINLFIYNPHTNTGRHLLDKNYGEISKYAFESEFNATATLTRGKTTIDTGEFSFIASGVDIKNNHQIPIRPIHNTILLETYHQASKTYTVWKADKLTGKSSVLFSYKTPNTWHLDVKNQVVRLVSREVAGKQSQLKITNYPW